MDDNLDNIHEDLINFLECLCEYNLPNDIENKRNDILKRYKKNIELQNQCSPYLNMTAGKGNGLMIINDENITEYIDPENKLNNSTNQDYYEFFPDNKKTSEILTNDDHDDDNDDNNNNQNNNTDDVLVKLYSSFSTELTKSKCFKCGPLLQKEERKFIGFNFEHLRSCWLGLVGTHLLVYSSKDEKQPSDIYSIRGYLSRAAPNATPRDPERGKSAFEIFSPGNKTFVFIARSPKDMKQWVEAICQLSSIQNDNTDNLIDLNISDTVFDEQYQDIDNKNDNNSIIINNNDNNDDTIIMSSRISRRLPSIPHEKSLSYEHLDDCYDDDSIYHKIDDLKKPVKSQELSLKILTKNKKLIKKIKNNNNNNNNNDIENINNKIDVKNKQKNEKLIDITSKKKSIFSRIKKDKNKIKINNDNNENNDNKIIKEFELTNYDDVTDYKSNNDNNIEQNNYTCPPAPRPISYKTDEVYDDICEFKNNEKKLIKEEILITNNDEEHYKVPRVHETNDPDQLIIKNDEELYDDIAILTEFRSRKRDSECSSSSSSSLSITTDKIWNKFSNIKILNDNLIENKIININKKNISSNNNNIVNHVIKTDKDDEDDDDDDDDDEENETFKLNKFQKLINKMEYSLSKSKPQTIINKNDNI